MRYRCVECGAKCTVSVPKGSIPTRCIIDDRDCCWMSTEELPTKSYREAHIRRCMIADAKGQYIERINPADPWNDIVIYRSIADASRDTGIHKGSIARAVRTNGYAKAGQYHWKRAKMTQGQTAIKVGAINGIEEYRQALKEHDPERYEYVFGGEE